MTFRYPALAPARKTGDERCHHGGDVTPLRVLDFWQWAVSDLVANITRGRVAEFIVASALGVANGARGSWDVCDVTTPSGRGIQAKSCAYLQAWGHAELTRIQFDISPRRALDVETNKWEADPKRHAAICVFCLLHHQDKASVDPLDLTQWTFYLVPTSVLDAKFPERRSLPLQTLLALNPLKAHFSSLRACVDAIEGQL
jgi:hypothetical protein